MDSMGNRANLSQAEGAAALAVELRAIFGKLKRKLREQGGPNDLTPSQVSVLLRLEKDGSAAVSSLARAEGMRPQSMSAIIASLLETGLVDGCRPKRQTTDLDVALQKCKKLLKEGRAARQDWLAQAIRQKLSPQEQKQLSSALHLLAQITED